MVDSYADFIKRVRREIAVKPCRYQDLLLRILDRFKEVDQSRDKVWRELQLLMKSSLEVMFVPGNEVMAVMTAELELLSEKKGNVIIKLLDKLLSK